MVYQLNDHWGYSVYNKNNQIGHESKLGSTQKTLNEGIALFEQYSKYYNCTLMNGATIIKEN